MTFSAIKIGSFAKVKGGKRLPKGAQLYDEPTEHPYIRVTDMYSDGLNSFQIKYIDQQTHDSISRYTISIHDVYISIAGTIGRVGMVPDTFNGANLTENAAKITDIDSSFNPRFLMYFLRSHLGQGQIAAKTGGTSQPKLALYRIEEIYCPKLPRDMQDEIVLAAKNYDDLIENNRRRIQLLEESARLLYQEWFVHLRFPGHEQVKIIDGVPEGWSIKRVDSLLGKVAKKKKIKKEEYLEDGVVPCVDQSQEFIGGYIDDEEAAITENLPVVVFGDHTRIVKFIDFPFAPGADGTQLLVPNDEEIPRDFFYFMISSINVANAFYARHFKFLKAKDVLVPEKKLMHEFSLVVKDNMLQIKLLRNQNRSLAKARDLLLPKLMSGELTV